jgi:hypothetical protein
MDDEDISFQGRWRLRMSDDDSSEAHIPPPAAPAAPPRAPHQSRSFIREHTIQLLNALQTNSAVDLTAFRESQNVDRRQIADICAVLAALQVITVTGSQTARLRAEERLTVPVNLSRIEDDIRALEIDQMCTHV